MANVQPLAQLHDIHMPKAIGLWPLAPGWWLLFLVFMTVVLFFSYRFFSNYIKNKPKRQALVLLKDYELEYQQTADVALAAARIGALLKRVALVYYPRQTVASLQGQAWFSFLNEQSKGFDFSAVEVLLLQAPYQATARGNVDVLFELARKWIVQRSYYV